MRVIAWDQAWFIPKPRQVRRLYPQPQRWCQMSNPDIAKHGLKKGEQRTKDIADKGRAAKKRNHSIRENLRRLAAFEPVVGADGKPSTTMNALKQAFGKDRKKDQLNMAEIWAIISAQQATQDFRAMANLIDNVDGMQDSKSDKKNAKSFADLVNAAAGNAPQKPSDDTTD